MTTASRSKEVEANVGRIGFLEIDGQAPVGGRAERRDVGTREDGIARDVILDEVHGGQQGRGPGLRATDDGGGGGCRRRRGAGGQQGDECGRVREGESHPGWDSNGDASPGTAGFVEGARWTRRRMRRIGVPGRRRRPMRRASNGGVDGRHRPGPGGTARPRCLNDGATRSGFAREDRRRARATPRPAQVSG